MAEPVDAPDLKSGGPRGHEGSTPSRATKIPSFLILKGEIVITQRDLRRFKNLEAKKQKAKNFLKEIDERIDFLKRKFVKLLQEGEAVEDGTRMIELLEKEPRASVSWLKEYKKLLIEIGRDIDTVEEIKEASKAGKPNVFDVKVF